MSGVHKLLVANRGEIAARVIRTARGMGLDTVAVFSDADEQAPYVDLADEAVRLPGTAPADTYLRIDAILRAAEATGADAVHPGYGFLSENADFAEACERAGLTFVGPPAKAVRAMGSKIEAKRLMAAAGVPVLPSGPPGGDPAGIGFPLLVKASFGGGGRGMRVVHDPADLDRAVAAAQREAASAFGDGTVFLERYLPAPRHVEVQIFADGHGNVVHLYERECSIQRRYQKIVEECPSPAVDAELRAALCEAAVAAAQAIGYVGAGTVEFVLDSDRRFYFLEVNTRLQVEHPVTEAVTGLDLVRLQLLVAGGEPLPDEVTEAVRRGPQGHAIEVRLYAEDVAAGFLPSGGTLHRLQIPTAPGIRVDSGVADGSVVSPYYDPMLAKVIAHAPSRTEAARALARVLDRAEIHGVTTNRDLLVGILRESEFLAGATDTAYLTRHDPVALCRTPDPAAVELAAIAAALTGQRARRRAAPVLSTVPSGWRNVPDDLQRVRYECGDRALEVGYRFGRAGLTAEVDGSAVAGLRVLDADADRLVVEAAGVRRVLRTHVLDDLVHVDGPLVHLSLRELPRFPEPGESRGDGSLTAPMPGSIVRLPVAVGDAVAEGDPIAVLEAMKMEHTVSAPYPGLVTELAVTEGAHVDTGDVIAVVTGKNESPLPGGE